VWHGLGARHDTSVSTSPRAELLTCADGNGDIATGALWLAVEECGEIDIPVWLGALDDLATELGTRYGAGIADAPPSTVAPVLAALLRDRLRLRGSDGADPRAHYLHTVMARGLGIPIACSTVWIAVGRRAGVAVDGVGLPGHFVVRIGTTLVDAHGGGVLLDSDAARALVARAVGTEVSDIRDEWLQGVTSREMLARMSRNLRSCHALRGDLRLALIAADRCVALLPGDPGERRERGALLTRAGATRAAIADLHAYLDAAPHAADRNAVESLLAQARALAN
jgi:regulator of sirC expression with transglutaminase-like and TPR domain